MRGYLDGKLRSAQGVQAKLQQWLVRAEVIDAGGFGGLGHHVVEQHFELLVLWQGHQLQQQAKLSIVHDSPCGALTSQVS